MKIKEPGHTYELFELDKNGYSKNNLLIFVKRQGEKYS